MWRHAGADEARQLVLSATVVACVLVAFYPLGHRARFEVVPVIVIVVGCMFTTAGMGAAALPFPAVRLAARLASGSACGWRSIGSRDAGAAAIREMLRSPGAGLVPVAVFDDDARAHGLSLLGVPVVGRSTTSRRRPVATPSNRSCWPSPTRRPSWSSGLCGPAETAGVTMKIAPRRAGHGRTAPGTNLAPLRQAREPRIEDLLGRTPVPTDLDTVRRSLAGRRVLVTGAGGSIGSEICRQVAELRAGTAGAPRPRRDPPARHGGVAYHRRASRSSSTSPTGPRSSRRSTRYRPEVVFHAAAHKHVPVLEDHPLEAAQTNVFGTLNVVDAAVEVGAQRFVHISTDKAVRPSSVMGASKRLAEQIVLCPSTPRGRLLHRAVRQRARAAGAASSRPSPARSPTAGRSR